VSDNSRRSRRSRSRSKDKNKAKGKRNLTATNEQILFMDASKGSVPISQSFFDNVASPCSYSAVLQQKPHNLQTQAHKAHILDRQQSFSAEQVGNNGVHNYFIQTTPGASNIKDQDDVIQQLNGSQDHDQE